ncbi:MAG: hypothetical protein L0387_04740 [Acidobacteria bacterium]|nr:hypothetical protein [Acidobacteriota bacterium]
MLDKARSFSNPPGFDQTMPITHSGQTIKLEGKQTTAKGETAISETYTLDGKRTSLQRQRHQARRAKARHSGFQMGAASSSAIALRPIRPRGQ